MRAVKTSLRVLICYDRDDDNTLTAIRNNRDMLCTLAIEFVRNQGRGAHGAGQAAPSLTRIERAQSVYLEIV